MYHRRPWIEPEAPFLLEVLYEDDDMVKFFLGNLCEDFFWVVFAFVMYFLYLLNQ